MAQTQVSEKCPICQKPIDGHSHEYGEIGTSHGVKVTYLPKQPETQVSEWARRLTSDIRDEVFLTAGSEFNDEAIAALLQDKFGPLVRAATHVDEVFDGSYNGALKELRAALAHLPYNRSPTDASNREGGRDDETADW